LTGEIEMTTSKTAALKRGVVFPSYRRIGPKDPGYAFVKACKDEGKWVCDAWTHNSRSGCANPVCFKYKGIKDFWQLI
jgi:hypothetical protein